MEAFPLKSTHVSLAVTATGGHLSDVAFRLDGAREIRPMHTAPWADETLDPDTPPILKMLRGDFFCAPFGSSDVLPESVHVHGLPANRKWRQIASAPGRMTAELDGTVMGATVTKEVSLRGGEAVVYQRHSLRGGAGRLPVGHHAMLRAEHPLHLAFSPWTAALTTPEPDETPPHGRSLLKNGRSIADLRRAERMDGSTVDLTTFPGPEGFEAILMLVTDRAARFSWTAATCAKEGWVWFALKNPRVLPQTLLWLSNGGRDYAPWNGRHRAIGLEEICGYFHLGHAASTADNPVAASGRPTVIELSPDQPFVVSYLFGLAPVPPDFGTVQEIVETEGGVRLIGEGLRKVFAACDVSFVAG